MAVSFCIFVVSVLNLMHLISGGLMSVQDWNGHRRAEEPIKEFKSRVCHVADISLIIDSSASVRRNDFQTGLQFLSNFTNKFRVGPNNVRVSVVTYGHKIFDHFGFDHALSNEELSKAILAIKHRGGSSTETGKAIKYMREKQMVLARPNVKKIAIVLTDGQSQLKEVTADESNKTHDQGIAVFAIGVGRATDSKELNGIASGKNYVFQVNNYDSLKTILLTLGTKACEVTTTTVATTPSTTTPEPKEEACGLRTPADVNFVFDAAYHGGPGSEEIIKFIDEVVAQDDMQEGMQVGCITSRCKNITGFKLNRYRDLSDVRAHLDTYVQSHLADIVQLLGTKGYTLENGARQMANRVSVIFIGEKVPLKEVEDAAKAVLKNDVINYVVNLGGYDNSELLKMVYRSREDYIFSGASMTDLARKFVNHLCGKETI